MTFQNRRLPAKRRLPVKLRGQSRPKLAASELFVGSFLLLILLGTLALKLLPGVMVDGGLSWVDAAFTVTSCVCVTGLIVVDTATYFTFFGQAILLFLIQCGGVGMLVITSVIISALGGRFSLNTEAMTHSTSHLLPKVPARKLIAHILAFTFSVEAIGALCLYGVWGPSMGWREAIWPSIFHSVSAFCNAGFSTNTYSLIPYQNSPATLLIISALIIIGGLGFITLEEFDLRWGTRGWRIRGRTVRTLKHRRLTTHSKLVLLTNAILLIGGCLLFAAFEWNGVLATLPAADKWCNAWFMSVTPRTAGFNSIDYAVASDCSNLLTILLMLVGGSPGSTAGGLKTTTLAVLVLLAWSRLRGYRTCVFASRSIPEETVQRATGLFVITSGIAIVGVFGIAALESLNDVKHSILAYAFEVASGLGTVGMSMGITSSLTDYSKVLLILVMIAGRVGPLAIAAILVVRFSRREKHRYAYEDVVVG